jgi:dihydroxyacid dehydratase/phosphogluconate dehydratase
VLFDTSLGVQKFVENGGTQGLVKAMIKNKMVDGNYKTFSGETIAERVKDTKNFENFLVPTRATKCHCFWRKPCRQIWRYKEHFCG